MESNGARSRTGYGKGIQGWNNSCYLDSVLMSLFYGTSCLDKIFLKEYPKSTNIEYSQKVSTLMSNVVSTLRSNNYCPKELILELRAKLAKVNPNITGEMEDVADFLQLLAKKGLNLNPFLIYTGGGSNFYHQIVLKHNSANTQESIPSIVNLQNLLSESLDAQKIAIQQLNSPLLAIKVPRANGILVRHQGIFPPLNLEVRTSIGTQVLLVLQAVICLKHCHYTCFIRSRRQWVFYDSMAAGGRPEVKPLPEMERIMTEWSQRLPVSSSIDSPRLPVTERTLYFRILTDIHMCFYVAPNASKDFGFYSTASPEATTKPRSNANLKYQSQVTIQPNANVNVTHHSQVRTQPSVNANVTHHSQVRPQPRATANLGYHSQVRPQPRATANLGNRSQVITQPRANANLGYHSQVRPQPRATANLGNRSQVITQPRANANLGYHSEFRPQPRANANNANLGYHSENRPQPWDSTNLENNFQLQTQSGRNITSTNYASSSSRFQESSVLQVHRRVATVPIAGASSPIPSSVPTTVLPHAMEHNLTFISFISELVVSGYTCVKNSKIVTKWVLFTKQFSYDLNSCLESLMEDGRAKLLKNNTFPRIGISQGIEMSKSNQHQRFALESFVFALFSNTRRNDSLFCQIITPNATHEYKERATNMQIVVEALRYHPNLCREVLITKLYQSLRIPSSTVEDVADLALHLFKVSLPQSPFIRQGNNVQTFLHPIIIVNDPRIMCVTTKQLLMQSMQYQNVSWIALRGPLFLSIQRNVLGGKRMLLDLTLQTSEIFSGMPPKVLSLIGFISRDKNDNYKSYAKYNSDQPGVNQFCWISMGIRKDGKPEVKACPFIEPQVSKTHEMMQRRNASFETIRLETEELWRIVHDIELLIYC